MEGENLEHVYVVDVKAGIPMKKCSVHNLLHYMQMMRMRPSHYLMMEGRRKTCEEALCVLSRGDCTDQNHPKLRYSS